ncbi:MAG: hypothetical protein HQK55_14565 [Deltaproteobacteria bacterium]|nr:hypothetical protein [Deltaproteobacteria bacterium]
MNLLKYSEKETSPEPSPEMRTLFLEAIKQGYVHLREKTDLDAIIGFLWEYHHHRLDLILTVAEHAYQCFPNEGRYALDRYHVAMRLKKPVDYFKSAVEELQRLIPKNNRSGGEPFTEDEDDEDEFGMEEIFSGLFGVSRAELYRDLIRKIKKYTAGQRPKKPGKKSKLQKNLFPELDET